MRSFDESTIGRALVLGLAVFNGSLAGCGTSSKSRENGTAASSGSVGLQLQVGGTLLTSVHYSVKSTVHNYEGDLDVADASHLLAVIGGIQAGPNYVLTLSANDGACAGQSAPFTVTPLATRTVNRA